MAAHTKGASAAVAVEQLVVARAAAKAGAGLPAVAKAELLAASLVPLRGEVAAMDGASGDGPARAAAAVAGLARWAAKGTAAAAAGLARAADESK